MFTIFYTVGCDGSVEAVVDSGQQCRFARSFLCLNALILLFWLIGEGESYHGHLSSAMEESKTTSEGKFYPDFLFLSQLCRMFLSATLSLSVQMYTNLLISYCLTQHSMHCHIFLQDLRRQRRLFPRRRRRRK